MGGGGVHPGGAREGWGVAEKEGEIGKEEVVRK